jgi:hypothetical protein
MALGFANSTYRQHRERMNAPQESDPALDPARHADAGDLANPALRQGRPPG